MPSLKRYDIKKLLANPDLRRRLIVESTRVTQAREDIHVSKEQVENSYYVVTEGERAAFFGLVEFRSDASSCDGRHLEFVRCLKEPRPNSYFEVSLRDFSAIESAPLAFARLSLAAPAFRGQPPLDPTFAVAKQGLATSDDNRWLRFHWEIPSANCGKGRNWCAFAKGGDFSRFYFDHHLVIRWKDDGRELKEWVKEREGSETKRIYSQEWYFKQGLTWPRRTAKGLNVRRLPKDHIFADKGPALFTKIREDEDYLLGVLNSRLFEFLFKTKTSFSWEVGIMKSMPIPSAPAVAKQALMKLVRVICADKESWDTGSENCTRFERPWLLQLACRGDATTLEPALEAVLACDATLDAQLTSTYHQLNVAVYRLYGVNEALRARIESAIGERPPEVIWPQMEGKTTEQKRMEHVCRLLSYAVKCVLEEEDDGLVSLQSVAQERPLLERVRTKLTSFFPEQDPHTLEIEVVNELKKRVKGYARAESLQDWLTHVFFDFHCRLYQQRPILWHLASSQESVEPAFSVIVHYHRFDHDRLAKLRSVHVRDRLATLRREAAQAGKDGREDDRLQLLAAVEEVEAFDRKLARLQEGHHSGAEGGDEDYRILTPWKKPEDRPKGWRPDLDDGVKVNIAPLARTGLLRIKSKFGAKDLED